MGAGLGKDPPTGTTGNSAEGVGSNQWLRPQGIVLTQEHESYFTQQAHMHISAELHGVFRLHYHQTLCTYVLLC